MTPNPQPSLSDKIGQMLIAGFRGYAVREKDPVVVDAKERNLGGIILFDREMADTRLTGRNIQSPEQVRRLTGAVQHHARTPLIVCIDQEGGRVNRLKPGYGFPETLSHEELGAINDLALTFRHAEGIARTLAGLGINLNLAPVVDLDAHPDNPVIKGKKRSFHSDPEVVAAHALQFVMAHRRHKILTCVKHFPGHGSATGDTHLGMVNVTSTWNERELIPFQRLIEADLCDCVMSAHVFNGNLDPEHPATLSKRILSGLLREKLGFGGVILSDDMEMKAISAHYGLEKAISLAIDAGVDVLCFGNNMSYDPRIGERVVSMILRLVKSGAISETRIDESHQRIMQLKANRERAGACP